MAWPFSPCRPARAGPHRATRRAIRRRGPGRAAPRLDAASPSVSDGLAAISVSAAAGTARQCPAGASLIEVSHGAYFESSKMQGRCGSVGRRHVRGTTAPRHPRVALPNGAITGRAIGSPLALPSAAGQPVAPPSLVFHPRSTTLAYLCRQPGDRDPSDSAGVAPPYITESA